MKRKKRLNKYTETLATRGRKVSIKSHSRRTRGGKRVVVKSYSRHTAGKKIRKPTSSGSEFEKRKSQSPYGEPITKRLHTFQGDDEDTLFDIKSYIGDRITASKRKAKEFAKKLKPKSSNKELNRVEKKLDAFMRKNGYQYKKYI